MVGDAAGNRLFASVVICRRSVDSVNNSYDCWVYGREGVEKTYKVGNAYLFLSTASRSSLPTLKNGSLFGLTSI